MSSSSPAHPTSQRGSSGAARRPTDPGGARPGAQGSGKPRGKRGAGNARVRGRRCPPGVQTLDAFRWATCPDLRDSVAPALGDGVGEQQKNKEKLKMTGGKRLWISPRTPPPRVTPPRGHGGGSAAAAVTLLAAFETSPAAAGSCPDFLPLPAGRRREIRLLGNEAPFPQKKPDLCAAGQRMLHFSFFFL